MSLLSPRQVHIDFHTPELPFVLGGSFDRSRFQSTLLDAHVTSATLTGRCHHGYIYYDTMLPARHPQMPDHFDLLMEEVEACHEVGIKAPIYLSVGWDAWCAARHPEWLERKQDGSLYGFEDFGQLSPGWKTLCFNSGYLEYLKRQARDTILHFGDKLDGLFFDIVWQDECLCESCIAKMIASGLDPEHAEERRSFAATTEQTLKHELTMLAHDLKPDCEIVFNEGNIVPTMRSSMQEYTHFEIESLPSGPWGYRHFPAAVRYVKTLGKPYLGMTARFHTGWADFGSYKNEVALEYETMLAFAHGAACSIGDQMYPDGSLDVQAYQLIGKVYNRLEKLEGVNTGVLSVSEMAILHPGISRISEDKVDPSLSGAVSMFSELGYQFDVIDDESDWMPYPLIVLPDCIKLTTCLKAKVHSYVAQGGRILASYESGLDGDGGFVFDALWGLGCAGRNDFNPTYGSFDRGACPTVHPADIVFHGPSLSVRPRDSSTRVIGREVRPLFQRTFRQYYGHFQAPAFKDSGFAVATNYGAVGYLSHPIFQMYREAGMVDHREIVRSLADRLLEGSKLVITDMPIYADIVLNWRKRDSTLVLNLLYYVPSRRCVTVDTIEDRIELHDRTVSIDFAMCRRFLRLDDLLPLAVRDPETGEEVSMIFRENRLSFSAPSISGYRILEIACAIEN